MMAVWSLSDMVPVGLDSLNGATDGSSQVSNSRSKSSTFLCEEQKVKLMY